MSVFIDVENKDTYQEQAENAINATTMQVGAGSKAFKVDRSGLFLGANKFADAPFSVDMDGNLTANTADLLSSINIGGSDATSFHVDADGNMWLGNAAFASAPFKVSNAGALTAQSVTIKDSSSDDIIDSSGLVSSTQFSPASVSGSGSDSTTSTSWSDVIGLTVTFSLDRSQNVLLFGLTSIKNDDASTGEVGQVQLLIDSTVVGAQMSSPGVLVWSGSDWTSDYVTSFSQEILTLASGSHTLKLQKKSAGGDRIRVSCTNSVVGYVILGK